MEPSSGPGEVTGSNKRRKVHGDAAIEPIRHDFKHSLLKRGTTARCSPWVLCYFREWVELDLTADMYESPEQKKLLSLFAEVTLSQRFSYLWVKDPDVIGALAIGMARQSEFLTSPELITDALIVWERSQGYSVATLSSWGFDVQPLAPSRTLVADHGAASSTLDGIPSFDLGPKRPKDGDSSPLSHVRKDTLISSLSEAILGHFEQGGAAFLSSARKSQ